MLLRRIINHVKTQNWTAVSLDFIIVVLGVFIGIQVSSWNAALDDRATEKAYLELLQRDLQSTMADVNAQIEFEQDQIKIANAAFHLIDEPVSGERRAKLGMMLTQLGARRTLKIESPTFLDLQSSGKLGLISDPNLRNDIVTYFYRIRRWEAIVDKNNEFFVDRSFNDFLDKVGVGFWVWDESILKAPSSMGYERMMIERIDEGLRKPGGSFLMTPPGSENWAGAVARLSNRASISVTNENFSRTLLDATVEIEQKIAAYLEE